MNFIIKKNHRTANAIRSGGERNPIRRRTQSNQTADGIQSDGERNPIRQRTQSQGVQQSLLHQQSKHILPQMAQINTEVL